MTNDIASDKCLHPIDTRLIDNITSLKFMISGFLLYVTGDKWNTSIYSIGHSVFLLVRRDGYRMLTADFNDFKGSYIYRDFFNDIQDKLYVVYNDNEPVILDEITTINADKSVWRDDEFPMKGLKDDREFIPYKKTKLTKEEHGRMYTLHIPKGGQYAN